MIECKRVLFGAEHFTMLEEFQKREEYSNE